MRSYCLSLTAKINIATAITEKFESAFADEGLPVSLFEKDEARQLWSVSLYVPEDHFERVEAICLEIIGKLDNSLILNSELLPQKNWVSHTLEELHPVRAGRFLVHGSHDESAPAPNDIAVMINAGLAFGTGHHGTTAGCLDMLGKVLKRGIFRNTLDLGTGSGVLAIAYAKATKRPILATDIDPIAIEVTKANARLNGVAGLVDAATATGFNCNEITNAGKFDLVIANILAGPLEKIAIDFARHCSFGATIILSGLLPHQKKRILASFRIQGFYFQEAHIRDNWLTLVLRYQVSC